MSLSYLRKTTRNKLQVPTFPRNLAAASIQQMQKCECIHGSFQYSHENNGLKAHPIRALDPAPTTISVVLPAATSSHLKPLLPYPPRQSMVLPPSPPSHTPSASPPPPSTSSASVYHHQQQQSEDDSENDGEDEDEDDDDDEYRNDQDEEDDDEEDEDYDMESRGRREQFDVEMREVVARDNASDDSEDMMMSPSTSTSRHQQPQSQPQQPQQPIRFSAFVFDIPTHSHSGLDPVHSLSCSPCL
ncbi:hypothetical protein BKA57DRAFT_523316 [Linnemannia elongata]|nr:hypothetical protein BKA57DRAFT_523316 [Linnemannia elongata]